MRERSWKTHLICSLSACLVGLGAAQAAEFFTDFDSGVPPNTAVHGTAFVAPDGGVNNSGVLRLTEAVTGQQGSFIVEDFTGGVLVDHFDVTFKARIGGGTDTPADGFSFNWATDLPDADFGEEGSGSGLTVAFDTFDNGGGEAPAVDIKWGGAVIGHQMFSAITGDNYVNARITLFSDGTIDVQYGTNLLYSRFVIPGFFGLTGARFGLGGRTGGLTENNWIDDLRINIFTEGPPVITLEPSDQTVIEAERAVFTIRVDGTPPYTVQWFSNNVAIPGANDLTYIAPPARPEMDGTLYRAEVSNTAGSTSTTEARLTVIPAPSVVAISSRGNPHGIYVIFTKDVNPATALDIHNYSVDQGAIVTNAVFTTVAASNGPQSVVLLQLATPGLTGNTTYTVTVSDVTDPAGNFLTPNPTIMSFVHNAGTICYDFDSGVPPGTQTFGSARVDADGGVNNSGKLNLTDAAGSLNGSWIIPQDQVNLGGAVQSMEVTFMVRIGDGTSRPADGFSFSFGPDVPLGTFGQGEEGGGSGIRVTFDTWDNNGDDTAPAIDVFYNNQIVGTRSMSGQREGGRAPVTEFVMDPATGLPLSLQTGSEYVPVRIVLDFDGTVDVYYKNVLALENVQTGYVPTAGRIGFGARTGGAWETHWIDDLCIKTFTAGNVVIVQDPQDQTVNENDFATFRVAVDGTPPYSFQWRKDGVDIPGATGQTYTVEAKGDLDGAKFSVVVNNEFSSATSAEATLHVILDTDAPTLTHIMGYPTPTQFQLQFSEPVSEETATNVNNYTVSSGAFVIGAKLLDDRRTVVVTVDEFVPFTPGMQYEVTIRDITDRSSAAHVIDPNPTVASFTALVCTNGFVIRDLYTGLSGPNTLATLTNNAKFPDQPDLVDLLPTTISPAMNLDNYGVRITGYLIPSVTGDYDFQLHSDDSSKILMSPNANPADATVLIEEPGCCRFLTVGPVHLEAGRAYWLQGLMQEGGGGDYLELRWRPSGSGQAFADIPSENLVACVNPDTFMITEHPADQTIQQFKTASFSVAATGAVGLTYQWQRSDDGGITFVDILDATNKTYSFLVDLPDNGVQIRAAVTSGGLMTLFSNPATVTVEPDLDPPQVVSITPMRTLTNVLVRFNEIVDIFTAQDAFNYVVGDFTVVAATVQPDQMSVVLDLQELMGTGTNYLFEVFNVQDLAGNPMGVFSTNFNSLVVSPCFAYQEMYTGIGGVLVSDLQASPKFPNSPDQVAYINKLEGPLDVADNYGLRISGFIVPSADGAYDFYISSDDQSMFYLSTDDNPANMVLVCQEPQWNGSRQFSTSDRRTAGAEENRSTTLFPDGINMLAGNLYYFQVLMKEGGGGDNVAVAWRTHGEPPPPAGSEPIPGINLATLADPTGVSANITQQPADQLAVVVPAIVSGSDFDSDNGGFYVETSGPVDGPWTYIQSNGVWRAVGKVPDCGAPGWSALISPQVIVPADGTITLTVNHRYSFEAEWDGGQIQLSVNGGPWQTVDNFVQNGYTFTNLIGNHVLNGQAGFNGDSPGHLAGDYITTIATLGPFTAGDAIQIRFIGAWDECTVGSSPNWEIDSVMVDPSVQIGSAVNPTEFMVGVDATVPGFDPAPVAVQWQRSDDGGTTWTDIAGGTGDTYTLVPSLADNGALFRALVCVPGIQGFLTSDAATLSVVALPPLSISRSGADVVISWPVTPDTWTLQSTDALASPVQNTVWTDVGVAPVVVGGMNTVTLPASDAQKFFRLVLP